MVRQAIEESGVDRDDIFLTSKVSFFPSSLEIPEDGVAVFMLVQWQEHRSAFGVDVLPLPPELPFQPKNVKGKELEAGLTFHPLNVKGREIEAGCLTKGSGRNLGTVQAIELSLQELGVKYLDLCLIHVAWALSQSSVSRYLRYSDPLSRAPSQAAANVL